MPKTKKKEKETKTVWPVRKKSQLDLEFRTSGAIKGVRVGRAVTPYLKD